MAQAVNCQSKRVNRTNQVWTGVGALALGYPVINSRIFHPRPAFKSARILTLPMAYNLKKYTEQKMNATVKRNFSFFKKEKSKIVLLKKNPKNV